MKNIRKYWKIKLPLQHQTKTSTIMNEEQKNAMSLDIDFYADTKVIETSYYNLVKNVLRELLEKEPSMEDMDDVVIFSPCYPFSAKIYVAYKNLKLGTITHNESELLFEPFQDDEFLEPATTPDGRKATFTL